MGGEGRLSPAAAQFSPKEKWVQAFKALWVKGSHEGHQEALAWLGWRGALEELGDPFDEEAK